MKINHYERKTYININSNDRLKSNIITTKKFNNKRIIIELVDYNKLKIYDNNNILNDKDQILFKNIKGEYDNKLNINTIGGIPVNYINFDNYKTKPIYIIRLIDKNTYEIILNLNIDKNLLNIGHKIEEVSITIEKIEDFKRGYEDASFYKIALPRKLKNIKKIKLINLEMYNSQNLVRAKVHKNDADNNNYISSNNYIYWINEDDLTEINNCVLMNEEKINILLDNNLSNIPNDWIYQNINEKIFYEKMSDTYLNKIKININILKYKFIDFLYLLKKNILLPTYNSITLSEDIINKIKTGYLIKFINSDITYILYLYDTPTNIVYDDNVRNFYIDSFYDNDLLLEFIYKYTNYNNITRYYNQDLAFNLENDTNITIEPINIYAYLKNNDLNYDNLLNNTLVIDYKNIKYYLLQHIKILLDEIRELDYNNYNIKDILIKLQYKFINYLHDLVKIFEDGLSITDNNIIRDSYLINFTKNSISYYLYLKERPLDSVVNSNIINYYIDDLTNIDNFINFIELYTNYDINTNNYNIETNFFDESTIYTQTTSPLNIYGYLKNISQNNVNNFIYNNENINYTFVKISFLKIIKEIIEEVNKCYINKYNLLENNVNLENKKYWKLPIKINTDIYNKTQKILTKDYLVESNTDSNDILNIQYLPLNNITSYEIYPVYSVNIKEGNYQSEELIEAITSSVNSLNIKKYDYYGKFFTDNINYNTKLAFNTEIDKHQFNIEYNETNNIVKMYQYKTVYSFSSLDITDISASGPFITNEGYPYIFVKHKDHKLYTGDIISISGASSVFNISSKFINTTHYIYTHYIYRCTIRGLIPLESGTISNDIDVDYYFEGNTFINKSSFNSDINRISASGADTKKHIGTNTKNLLLDYDLSKYELISIINNTNNNNNIVGRVINFRKDNETSNYIVDYALLSDNNFEIGDIIKSNTTNSNYMIIPDNWTYDYLPKNKDIIKSESKIAQLDNIVEGYSIKTDVIPNKTSLSGIGGININIKIPVNFSLLFNRNNTINNILGFENKETNFNYYHSNTIDINNNLIEYSYLEPTFNESIYETNRYIYMKTVLKHDYNVGDIIYINNHLLNYNFINSYNITSLNIDQYEPFISWYNKLDYNYQVLIKNNLTNEVFSKYKTSGIIIYYNYIYHKKQEQDLGNIGMCSKKYKNSNYFNYKEKPIPCIFNLKENSYIHIIQNQKSIMKQIDNENIEYKVGLRDGYYKVLNNLPCITNSYYSNYFNNTNCAIIECDYTTISDTDINNKLNYSEFTTSNSNDYTENILEGYLNKGSIKTSSLDTSIIGSDNCNYNLYKTKLKQIIENKHIQLYFPIKYTTQFNLQFINNNYYINNINIDTINIYKNIPYYIDISDYSLKYNNLIISNKKNNEIIINNDNIYITGPSGEENSKINIYINLYDNISNLYLINTDTNINIIKFNVIEHNEIIYNVKYFNNTYIFENNNSYFENLLLHIQLGQKYILQFDNQNIYNNFIIITHNNFNNNVDLPYFTYDDLNKTIYILLTDNNYPRELYYHYKNSPNISGKIIFSLYYYYNIDKSILINTNYIDNINKKLINSNKKENCDLNIIDDIFILPNSYYFSILLKKNTYTDITEFIYPYYHFNYLQDNVSKNQNIIKLKKSFDLVLLKTITIDNLFILEESNKHFVVNNIIKFLNNIPGTDILINSEYYILYVNENQTEIKIGDINTKKQVIINKNIILDNIQITIKILSSYDYNKYELLNKSIKINYMQSKQELISKTYNDKLTIINNDVSILNISNNCYYNTISENYQNMDKLENLSWTTPYGSIRLKFKKTVNLNYIKLIFSNSNINNNPAKIHLYYIENNVNYYITTNNVNIYNINNTLDKEEYLIYIETEGLINNIYSELKIDMINIGNYNNITNNITNLNEKISNIKINNITNNYDIPIQYLDNNTYNEYNSLLLNKSKSSIISINLRNDINIKYYKFSQYLSNHSIIIDGVTYNNYYEFGKITGVQLFGSNNINFIDEVEIIDARYSNLDKFDNNEFIEKTFNNTLSFKYYRFKLLNNFDYFPYNNKNFNNINDISNLKFIINISGFEIGTLKNINNNDLYIEDLNYITDILDSNIEYITLKLKYDLLNNHIAGENFIICDNYVSQNCYSTQNLIIYGEWYTRIYYKGYNTIYNYYKNSKTQHNNILHFSEISDYFNIHGNSTYTFIHSEYLDIYINTTPRQSITSTDENINLYNITKKYYKKELIFYSEFTINIPYFTNIDNKFILSNLENTNSKIVCIHDSYMNEGIPIIQEYLTNNITIENMNGFYIPEINYSLNNNTFKYKETNNIIVPLIDNNYDTETYTSLDLIYKSDTSLINNTNTHFMKNGRPIYGSYISSSNWSDNYINNKNEFYTNFYSILIKGKYQGFNGKINNKINNKKHIINKSKDGFKIIDIKYDENNIKKFIKIDLKLNNFNISSPFNYLGNIDNITDITQKNKYILGYGGNICEKTIYNTSKFTGEKYIYLSINKLNKITTTNQINYFSKIILNNEPGNNLYDNFIDSEIIYDDNELLDELEELEIKFINDEGKLYNFNKSEHSFVFEITEINSNFEKDDII